MSLEHTQQTIDHYFDVMTRGGDFAVYYTDDVTWTMTDTGDEVRGPSSVRDYIVALHSNMLDAHTRTIVVSDGHAYIEGDCQAPTRKRLPDPLLRHVRHRRWPNHSHALLRSRELGTWLLRPARSEIGSRGAIDNPVKSVFNF